MSEKEVIQWCQDNLTIFSKQVSGSYALGFQNKEGLTQYVYGNSLIDCVFKASQKK